MRVLFHRDDDHKWPSRAVTAFKAGYEGTVHRHAGAAAIAKGVATEVPRPAKAAPHGTDENGRADSVGGSDHRPAVPGGAGGAGGHSGRDRGADGGAIDRDQSGGNVA